MKNRFIILVTIVSSLILLSPILAKDVEAKTNLDGSDIISSLIGQTSQDNAGLLDFLKAESVIKLDYDESLVEDPLIPDTNHNIPINISYSISGLFAGLYSKLLSNSEATIDLSVETNEYVKASISPESVKANITTEETKLSVKPEISVNIDSSAVARNDLKITVIAKAKEVKGLLGLFSLVKEGDNVTKDITLKPEFVPDIDVESNIDFKEIPPFNVTKLYVNITNKGNGQTKITMEAINVTDHFNVSLQDSILLDINQNETVIIEVTPDNNFDEESLEISFTPSFSEDSSLTGSSTIQTFTLKNDGSYKEEDNGLEIDISIIIILGFAILILLVIIFIIRKRL